MKLPQDLTPYDYRADGVFLKEFRWGFDKLIYQTDETYCLDAPECIPAGSFRSRADLGPKIREFTYTRREGQSC